MKKLHTIITCEHAGKDVPNEFIHLFDVHDDVLQSHRGWDPGAWEVAQLLASSLNVPLFGCHTTRLLIETNRSLNNGQLFSEFSKQIPDKIKDGLIREVYHRYRNAVEAQIEQINGDVLHLSIHSFTPVLNSQVREVEIGLLFDPERREEGKFCRELASSLKNTLPGLKIEFNEPYKGTDDGFTTYLRTCYTEERYRGIEIELNQKFVGSDRWEMIKKRFTQAVRNTPGVSYSA